MIIEWAHDDQPAIEFEKLAAGDTFKSCSG